MFAYASLISALMLAMIGMAAFASIATYWPYNLKPTLKHYTMGLVDAEVGFAPVQGFRISAGARNIFDVYPDKMSENNGFDIFPWPPASWRMEARPRGPARQISMRWAISLRIKSRFDAKSDLPADRFQSRCSASHQANLRLYP